MDSSFSHKDLKSIGFKSGKRNEIKLIHNCTNPYYFRRKSDQKIFKNPPNKFNKKNPQKESCTVQSNLNST